MATRTAKISPHKVSLAQNYNEARSFKLLTSSPVKMERNLFAGHRNIIQKGMCTALFSDTLRTIVR